MHTQMQPDHVNQIKAQANPWKQILQELQQAVRDVADLPLPERLLAFMKAQQRIFDGFPDRQCLPTWQVKTFFRDVTTAKARTVLKKLESEGKVYRSENSTPTNSIWKLVDSD